jgi:hypothetical protein
MVDVAGGKGYLSFQLQCTGHDIPTTLIEPRLAKLNKKQKKYLQLAPSTQPHRFVPCVHSHRVHVRVHVQAAEEAEEAGLSTDLYLVRAQSVDSIRDPWIERRQHQRRSADADAGKPGRGG